MIQTFLVIYALITLVPLSVWIRKEWKEYVKAHAKKAPLNDVELDNLQKALNDKGIKAQVHRIPEDPVEAIIQQTARILETLNVIDKHANERFQYLRNRSDSNHHDMHAVMISEEALLKAINGMVKPMPLVDEVVPAEKSQQQFAAYFEYARDNLPIAANEKEVINTIIKRLKSNI